MASIRPLSSIVAELSDALSDTSTSQSSAVSTSTFKLLQTIPPTQRAINQLDTTPLSSLSFPNLSTLSPSTETFLELLKVRNRASELLESANRQKRLPLLSREANFLCNQLSTLFQIESFVRAVEVFKELKGASETDPQHSEACSRLQVVIKQSGQKLIKEAVKVKDSQKLSNASNALVDIGFRQIVSEVLVDELSRVISDRSKGQKVDVIADYLIDYEFVNQITSQFGFDDLRIFSLISVFSEFSVSNSDLIKSAADVSKMIVDVSQMIDQSDSNLITFFGLLTQPLVDQLDEYLKISLFDSSSLNSIKVRNLEDFELFSVKLTDIGGLLVSIMAQSFEFLEGSVVDIFFKQMEIFLNELYLILDELFSSMTPVYLSRCQSNVDLNPCTHIGYDENGLVYLLNSLEFSLDYDRFRSNLDKIPENEKLLSSIVGSQCYSDRIFDLLSTSKDLFSNVNRVYSTGIASLILNVVAGDVVLKLLNSKSEDNLEYVVLLCDAIEYLPSQIDKIYSKVSNSKSTADLIQSICWMLIQYFDGISDVFYDETIIETIRRFL
ncbi:hypothetical protein P9112_008055 [Eukaryota sp. TZLM1-RC]